MIISRYQINGQVRKIRILLVEDEESLTEALEHILLKNNYLVDIAYDGISGQDMVETGIYDLIILDRMLPGKEGVSILREIRANGINCPVIFLTAKDTVANRVEGLDAGADDYLIKPFSSDELLARVRALARRTESKLEGNSISSGFLSLDPLQCEATCGNKTVKLTLKESQLLELLLRNKGQVLTKEQILERVWGYDSEVVMNSIELYIYYLRKKLSEIDCRECLHTVRGIGYCLRRANNV